MGVNRADLADLFFTEFEKRFSGIDAVCDGNGPPSSWTITDVENPRFRLRFAFEEESNDPGLTLVIKEIVTGPGRAGLLRGVVGFAIDFVERHCLYDIAIGTMAEDDAARQRFVNALREITPRLRPAEPGCVRMRTN